MELTEIMTIINTVGFPIFCVLGLGFYIFKNDQKQREERDKTNEILMNFALNLQANTNALQNLSEIIKGKQEENK